MTPRNPDAYERVKLRREFIERCEQMTDTEHRVKAERLRKLGGWWPLGIGDWETSQGRRLGREIEDARR